MGRIEILENLYQVRWEDPSVKGNYIGASSLGLLDHLVPTLVVVARRKGDVLGVALSLGAALAWGASLALTLMCSEYHSEADLSLPRGCSI